MNILVWEVYIQRTPFIVKYCKRCGKSTKFESSGLFRVNYQKKLLDIWLIYRCYNCDMTWNLAIFSRLHINAIKQEMLDRIISNDNDMVMNYATDAALLKRNGVKCDTAEAEVIGAAFNWVDTTEIHIVSKWPLENKAASLISQKLGISRNVFNRMCDDGTIISLSGQKLKSCKMVGEIIILVAI